MNDPCAKLVYRITDPELYSDPSASDGNVPSVDQPETNASAAAQVVGARLNDALMNLFAPLRTLTGGE